MVVDETVIKLSKAKLGLSALGSIVFVAIGIWLVSIDIYEIETTRSFTLFLNSPVLVYGIGGSSVMFFGLMGVIVVKKLLDRKPGLVLNSEGIMEVYGQGSVTIVDGSQITYNEIAEVGDNQEFSVCGVQLHVLRDGLFYDFLNRHPMQIPNEFLLPDIA